MEKYVNMTDIISAQELSGQELGEQETVALIELLFFAYRDFVSDPDEILGQFHFGRAHHRVLHFVGRDPGMTVQQLLDILRITKQSLGRVLKELIDKGYVYQREGIRRAVGQSGDDAARVYRKVLYHMVSPENRAGVRDWIDRSSIIGEKQTGGG
jgi:DNA-binding transcriptional ArsR family regulator